VASVGAFERVIGKQSGPVDPVWLAEHSRRYGSVELDIGTGDGRYVLDAARADPERLVIGVDAVAGNMVGSARKASASTRKGGLENAVFFRGGAEQFPGPFAGLADWVTINYPWGSLMRIVAEPDTDALRCIRESCKLGARLHIFLNYTVILDRPYLERLGLGALVDPVDNPSLHSAYEDAGFVIQGCQVFAGDPPVRTRWGRQLVRGAARQTLSIEATAGVAGGSRWDET
jgi:16S rRNA (adenine(1408)-N(1))-methyltransferase